MERTQVVTLTNVNIIMEYPNFAVFIKEGKTFVTNGREAIEVEEVARLNVGEYEHMDDVELQFKFESDVCGELDDFSGFVFYKAKKGDGEK